MRRALVLGLAAAVTVSAAAQARGHGAKDFGGAYKAPAAGRHRHASPAKIESLGPSTFEPVKPYKGFSYLDHGKRRHQGD